MTHDDFDARLDDERDARPAGAELERLRAEVAAWRRALREGREARHRVHELESRGRAALHRRSTCADADECPARRPRRVSRSRAASIRPGIAASCGRCASSRASAAPSDTNERFKFLLEHGQTGLSTAFDFPTLMGYDSDHPRSEGEVGKTRRRDLEPRRHGDAVRRDSARPGLDVDDDQRPGDHPVLASTSRPRRSRACRQREAARHGAERHPEGVHGAARVVLPDRARAASHRRLLRVGRAARAAVEHRSRSPATTSAKPDRPRRRSSRSRSPTGSPTSSAASRAGSTSTTSRRASRSSGTSTTTSSRRSPSCARRAASGRAT